MKWFKLRRIEEPFELSLDVYVQFMSYILTVSGVLTVVGILLLPDRQLVLVNEDGVTTCILLARRIGAMFGVYALITGVVIYVADRMANITLMYSAQAMLMLWLLVMLGVAVLSLATVAVAGRTLLTAIDKFAWLFFTSSLLLFMYMVLNTYRRQLAQGGVIKSVRINPIYI